MEAARAAPAPTRVRAQTTGLHHPPRATRSAGESMRSALARRGERAVQGAWPQWHLHHRDRRASDAFPSQITYYFRTGGVVRRGRVSRHPPPPSVPKKRWPARAPPRPTRARWSIAWREPTACAVRRSADPRTPAARPGPPDRAHHRNAACRGRARLWPRDGASRPRIMSLTSRPASSGQSRSASRLRPTPRWGRSVAAMGEAMRRKPASSAQVHGRVCGQRRSSSPRRAVHRQDRHEAPMTVTAAAAALVAPDQPAPRSVTERFFGTWQLVSWRISNRPTGTDRRLRSSGMDHVPAGRTYERVASHAVSRPADIRLRQLDGCHAEIAAAFAGYVSDRGSRGQRAGALRHAPHRVNPNLVGTQQKRFFAFAGDRLTLETPPRSATRRSIASSGNACPAGCSSINRMSCNGPFVPHPEQPLCGCRRRGPR